MSRHLIIIGAQRSGSTYLYRLLDEHPDIAMSQPVRPEPKYFLDEANHDHGGDHYRQTVFAGTEANGAQWRGEKSTTYIEHPALAPVIDTVLPAARVLVILRNPVERAWSNYKFSRDNDLEDLPFDEALEREPARTADAHAGISTSPYAYRTRGQYARYLTPWIEQFGDRMRILIFEELVGNADAVADLYSWLDVDITHIPDSLTRTVNASAQPDVPPEAVMRRLADSYATDIADLEALLGRRIDPWRAAWESLA